MATLTKKEAFCSFTAHCKFGKRYAYGRAAFGESEYGGDPCYSWLYGFGKLRLGKNEYGDDDCLSGIFQKGFWNGKTKIVREDYMWPKNPNSVLQQIQRQKYADGVAAYQALTPDQKIVYHKKAYGLQMNGYNLFLKKYLLSH